MPSSAAGCELRAACAEDVEEIFALMQQVFGGNQLLYTIYQAPRAVGYLRKLVATQAGEFTVLRESGSLAGYYHALCQPDGYFLNYIAVQPALASLGHGRALLQHFEGAARATHMQQVGLDVFQSNRIAVQWYQRAGYRETSVSHLARLILRKVPAISDEWLEYDQSEWEQALDQERQQGFSKVECRGANGRITLGLIGGTSCKLLSAGGHALPSAVQAIAHTFREHRELLIVASGETLPYDLPFVSAEICLRMLKPLPC